MSILLTILFLPASSCPDPIHMKRPVVAFALLALSMASGIPVRAELRSFLVPANDGYGVADCLAEAGSCGRIVADAWCQAQGMKQAASFGPSDPIEVTASISNAQAASAKTYTVTCND